MAEHHGYVVLARVGKPGRETFRGVGRRFLGGQLQAAILCNKAHTGEVIGDHPPAIHAGEGITPAFGLIAIHLAEVFAGIVAADHRFHFPGTGHGLFHAPDMGQAGVGHQQVAPGIVNTQVLLA